jgi:hypothetical protein
VAGQRRGEGVLRWNRGLRLPERIYKLQPNRTLALRGFDDLGAGAALHSATPNSFAVSGVFRDPADFAVLVLYDADNFYEHPDLKYLPDTNFAGLALTFDVQYTGLMPLDSPKYASIDWPFLDVIRPDGTTASIRLHDCSVQNGGTWTAAQAEFTIEDNGLKEYDRLTLWYQNIAFDYFVPQVECVYSFSGAGPGTVHGISVAGTPYTYTENGGDSDGDIAQALVDLLAASEFVTASRGTGTVETGPANQVNLRGKKDDGLPVQLTATPSGIANTIFGVTAKTVARALADQVNSTNWTSTGVLHPLSALAATNSLKLACARPGEDGNMLRMYAVAKNARLRTGQDTVAFRGGVSDAVWRVTIDFSARGIADVRQMWLTFAPKLADAAAYQDTEWEAAFTNWNLSGPEPVRMLQVAGPGSYRIEESAKECVFTGNWPTEYAFYSEGYARSSSKAGDKVTVTYRSSSVHDLWVGTSLYVDRGSVGATLDGDSETVLNAALNVDAAVNTRRKVRSGVAAGLHTLTLTLKEDKPFYFDFLETVVPSDIPERFVDRPNLSPALDYSTDHTYKLAPARILWIFDQLGFTAPMNEYIGVFWWNQRKRTGASFPHVQVTFSGTYQSGDAVFLKIGKQPVGKSVFPNENTDIVARHFEFVINSTFVGVWAKASGNVLDIWTRSPKDTFYQTFDAWTELSAGSGGAVSFTGRLDKGAPGRWEVDPQQTPALNHAARQWHADLFRECKARNREIVVSSSMELVFPPAEFAARYPDQNPVETDVGFNSMRSTHCAFSSPMAAYHKQVFTDIAGLMTAAGLTPNLQCGEFTWWYFTNQTSSNPAGGMAYYDPETSAAAQANLGRSLHVFRGPNENPGVNASADAIFLRDRLRQYVAALIAHVRAQYPSAKFEVLFPYDVNHPVPAGVHGIGGQLNRFVNLPVEWEKKTTAGFDRIKMEALDFGVWSRNLDLIETAIKLPTQLGWPADSVRHIAGVYRPGYAWEKEFRLAIANGIQVINLWAFDHICIFGWPPADETGLRRALKMG